MLLARLDSANNRVNLSSAAAEDQRKGKRRNTKLIGTSNILSHRYISS